jgi:hypothetical protein
MQVMQGRCESTSRILAYITSITFVTLITVMPCVVPL